MICNFDTWFFFYLCFNVLVFCWHSLNIYVGCFNDACSKMLSFKHSLHEYFVLAFICSSRITVIPTLAYSFIRIEDNNTLILSTSFEKTTCLVMRLSRIDKEELHDFKDKVLCMLTNIRKNITKLIANRIES